MITTDNAYNHVPVMDTGKVIPQYQHCATNAETDVIVIYTKYGIIYLSEVHIQYKTNCDTKALLDIFETTL